jgi:hypothetical protein
MSVHVTGKAVNGDEIKPNQTAIGDKANTTSISNAVEILLVRLAEGSQL